jgi:RNA polymerase sigma factor (sigma-70 family)
MVAPRDIRAMSAAMSVEPIPLADKKLADPALRKQLEDFVRRRVPAPDVDDVVQTVLLDALAAMNRPEDATELRKWLLGVARHKVVDHHRRALRELASEIPEVEANPAPIEERELLRWAEEQAGPSSDAKRTLAWMAREGEGEKLEQIAAEEKVPAARVRQRVSRMRRWMKDRWIAEVAAVAVLGVLALIWWLTKKEEQPQAKPDKPAPSDSVQPEPPREEVARRLRRDAIERCDQGQWKECVDGLDRARELDPAGDTAPSVEDARKHAVDATTPTDPTSIPIPSSQPTSKLEPPLDSKDSASKVGPAPKPVATSATPSDFSPPTKTAPKKKGGKPASDFDLNLGKSKAGTGTGAK